MWGIGGGEGAARVGRRGARGAVCLFVAHGPGCGAQFVRRGAMGRWSWVRTRGGGGGGGAPHAAACRSPPLRIAVCVCVWSPG